MNFNTLEFEEYLFKIEIKLQQLEQLDLLSYKFLKLIHVTKFKFITELVNDMQ